MGSSCIVLQGAAKTNKQTNAWALPSNSSPSPRQSRQSLVGRHTFTFHHRYGFPVNPGEVWLFPVSTREPQQGVALTSKGKEQFPWGSLSGRTPQSSLGSSRPALAEYNPGCLSASLLLPHLLTSVSARIPPIAGDRRLLCLPLRILPSASQAKLFMQDSKLGHSQWIGVIATFRWNDKNQHNSNKETLFLLGF